MIKFIQLFFLFLIPFFVVAGIYAYTFGRYIPAPRISNSFSLNEKIDFSLGKKADYVAIGSSLVLNNINSAEMVKYLPSKSYLNFASWGVRMAEIYPLIKAYSMYHKPKAIILSSNVVDFRPLTDENKITFDIAEINSYLNNPGLELFYWFKHFNIHYYYEFSFENRKTRNENDDYSALKFDEYGGVPLADSGFKIEAGRWHLKSAETLEDLNFMYLDSICQFTSKNNIKLIFIYSKIRQSAIDSGLVKKIYPYSMQQIKAIVNKYNIPFYDSNSVPLGDSAFVDMLHIKETASKAFTDSCLQAVILPSLRN